MVHWLILLAATLGATSLTASAASAPLTLLTEDYPPYAWKDANGKVRGVSSEIISTLMRRADVEVLPLQILPWARALAITLRNDNTCIFTAARTKDREGLFQWVGPIATFDWVFFARRQDNIKISSLEDIRALRVGTYFADASINMLSRYDIRANITSSIKSNPLKLKHKRIDLWASSQVAGTHLLQTLGMQGIVPVYTFATTDMYLACNASVDMRLISVLNIVLKEMHADNSVSKIYARYGLPNFAGISSKR